MHAGDVGQWPSFTFGVFFLSCEADARIGGSDRFVFGHPWTNEEAAGGPVTTVTFEDLGGQTRVYPSKQALDDAIASMGETCVQLDELLAELGVAVA